MSDELKEEVLSVINSLVSLVYDLAPDDEYMDMYGVNNKIAAAQHVVNQLQQTN
jgi:hypothetical protein